jgi:hypothetical protein
VISLQNALYFRWAWHGGRDPGPATPGFNPRGNTRARAVFDELANQFTGLAIEPDDFTFTPDRQFITGVRVGGAPNPQVSEHFAYTAYSAHFPPNLLAVRLARMVQLLRHRCKKGVAVDALLEDGQGAWLKASPHNAANLKAVVTSATAMRDDGLFTFLMTSGDRVQVSVSGVLYDAAGTYITGRHADVPDPLLTHDLRFLAFNPLIAPFRLHRNLPQVMSRCMQAVSMTLTPRSITDNGDTLVINGGGRGVAVLSEAQVHAAFGTIARATYNASNDTVSLSMS